MVTIDNEKLDIRVMIEDDIQPIVEIDAQVSGKERNAYYERKMAQMLDRKGQIATSLVAEYDGRVIGFIMGNIYIGEFGIPETTAVLDTIGIDPDFGGSGMGSKLMEDFLVNVEAAGATNVQTQVELGDTALLDFFHKNGFTPAWTLSLEKKIR